MRRRLAAPRGGGIAVFVAAMAAATATRAAGPELRLEATSLLGSTVTERGGWRSLLLRLENPAPTALEGTLEIESRPAWLRSGQGLRTSLPFSLPASGRVSVEAPTHGFPGGEETLRIRARDRQGRILAEAALSEARPSDALVLHLSSPSRIAPVLRGVQFGSRRTAAYGGRLRSAAIGVASAAVDTTTGDLVLPERAAGYSEATLVLGSGQKLAGLSEPARAALYAWLLSGGALAVFLDRPEDFTEPSIAALLSAAPKPRSAPAALSSTATFWIPPDDADASSGSPTALRPLRLRPAAGTAGKLKGYEGGNLRPTAWGASATYGLGEVHLLAFDPDDPETAADPWARYKLADLVRHAFDREPQAVLRNAVASPDSAQIDGIRRELDPNQASRWTIVVSAVVLLLYAVLAGPVGFYFAARKGRPLRALWQLPIWSAATLGVIVLFGILGKGISGRARRLTVVETGAGMTSGAALSFRGFYAAGSRELLVRPMRREHVLDLAGFAEDVGRTLLVDRDGPRLIGLRTKPWQTVLIREDGFADLSGGISIVPEGADYVIKNRTARDLLGAVFKPLTGETRYFPRIRDGEGVRVSRGRALGSLPMPAGPAAPLFADSFANALEADFVGLGRAWKAIEPALAGGSEWWPSDAPVLIGALEGGQGKLSDSGLAVDYDRVLVRIVGTGGVP